jgi:uncharacterized protein (DUF1810 family)
MSERYNLQRFVDAQEGVFEQVLAELRSGRKSSHWMWFVFPQLRGLGSSAMASRFGISSLGEAEAYLQHPVLGQRLRQCAQLAIDANRPSITQIFAPPDHLKFRSSMSLFLRASPDRRVFQEALDRYFGGEADPLTLERLGVGGP